MTDWSEIISNPSVSFTSGFRGRGKSALNYHLVEKSGDEYSKKKIAFGIPMSAHKLLPDDWEIINLTHEFPSNSVIIVDEVSLAAYARRAMSKTNELWDRIVANSRKNDQIILLVSHHSRKVDINLVMDLDNLIYKKPSKLQIRLDRPAVRGFSKVAYEYLKDKDKSYSYVFSFSKDKEVALTNPLPHFWSDELSETVSIVGTEEDPVIQPRALRNKDLKSILERQNMYFDQTNRDLAEFRVNTLFNKYTFGKDVKNEYKKICENFEKLKEFMNKVV